jgi:phage tail-like protein
MTAGIHAYRFGSPSQWRRCLLHGFDPPSSAISLSARFAADALPVGARDLAAAVTVDRDDRPTWLVESAPDNRVFLARLDEFGGSEIRFEIDETLARATRWIADRRWLWTFTSGASIVSRYDLRTLEPDLSRDLEPPSGGEILDITSDGHEGLWLIVASGGPDRWLQHLDCEGRPNRQVPVPGAACRPSQIGSLARGGGIAILAAEGRRLVFTDLRTGSVGRVLDLENIAEGLKVARMATDARQRIALWGHAAARSAAVLVVLDAAGDTTDGPLVPRFGESQEQDAAEAPDVADIAVSAKSVWLSSTRGLWRLATDGPGSAGADGTLLTPALISPESYIDRGWLRAELDVELPRGAVIEASFAGTKNDAVATELRAIADDLSAPIEHRQQLIWSALEHPPGRTFTLTGPAGGDGPVAFPLFDAAERWLWLRLRVVSPPGTPRPAVRQLRVLYPNASIDRNLPATFKGENDPTGVLRRLVGVLETTTQRIDDRIAAIGTYLQADSAPEPFLNYIARWFDLPWDDGLGVEAKRAVLEQANAILEQRGTRRGLDALLSALLGGVASARVSDVTVDHPVRAIGGGGRRGVELPLILTGASTAIATLGVKAVLGRARLRCVEQDIDPLRAIVPTVTIRIAAAGAAGAQLKALLPGILAQYLPAGIVLRLRWQTAPFADAIDADGLRLDADGPGRLGDTSSIGRTILSGRTGRTITESGVDADLRLT